MEFRKEENIRALKGKKLGLDFDSINFEEEESTDTSSKPSQTTDGEANPQICKLTPKTEIETKKEKEPEAKPYGSMSLSTKPTQEKPKISENNTQLSGAYEKFSTAKAISSEDFFHQYYLFFIFIS